MISRFLTALATVTTLVTVTASTAAAGTFEVTTCDDAPDGVANNAWTYSQSPAGHLDHGDDCSIARDAVFLEDKLGLSTSAPSGATGYWNFAAPSGTVITGISYRRQLYTYLNDGWLAELRADNATLESCRVPPVGDTCNLGGASTAYRTFSGLAASSLRVGARCDPIAPDTVCITGSSLHSVVVNLYGARVTIDDPGVPSLGGLGGTLLGSGWLRGTQTASFSALDATGIDKLELLRGASVIRTDDRSCDYTRPAPCANPNATVNASWTPVDTTTFPDGVSTLTARASDAAGNAATTTPVQVQVDNTAPAAPSPSADIAWSNAADATWSVPVPPEAGVAPIDQVEVEVCSPTCTTSQLTPPSSGPLAVTRTVGEGMSTLRARLRDAAGNVSPWSSTVPVRRDRTAPAPSSPTADNAWSAAGTAAWSLAIPAQSAAPVADVDIEICSSSCVTETVTAPASGPLTITRTVGEGTTTLRARLRDAAGNVGAYSAIAAVRRDRTGPQALSSSSSETWRTSSALPASWTLPTQDSGSPYATVEFELCPTPNSCVVQGGFTAADGTAGLTIPADGDGTIRSRLIDQGGNVGAWSSSRPMRLDRGLPPAPQLSTPANNGDDSFTMAVTPADPGPAPIVSLTFDVCQGVSGACVTQPVPATAAQVRTQPLAPGSWRLRVRSVDAAGNVGSVAERTASVVAATPTPTASPSPSATASPSPSPSPSSTPSPTTTPIASPSPSLSATPTPSVTPTATVAPAKLQSRLAIVRVRLLTDRVRVVGRLAAAATGSVRVVVASRGRRASRRVLISGGHFSARLSRPSPVRRSIRVRVSYGGDDVYRPATVRRRVQPPSVR